MNEDKIRSATRFKINVKSLKLFKITCRVRKILSELSLGISLYDTVQWVMGHTGQGFSGSRESWVILNDQLMARSDDASNAVVSS